MNDFDQALLEFRAAEQARRCADCPFFAASATSYSVGPVPRRTQPFQIIGEGNAATKTV